MSNVNKIDINLSSSVFLTELFNLSKDIIWKNQSEANKNEIKEASLEREIFMAASKGLLSFDSIYQFPYDILAKVGLSEKQIYDAIDDKRTIPDNLRNICVKLYVEDILAKDPTTGRYINYNEENNYYRMLYGLPDNEDTNFIYNTKYDDIPKDVPIHELSISNRYALESRGYLDELIKLYPDKKYIKHLGTKCIDPYIARSAERFSILHMNTSEYENLYTDFQDTYNNCRYNITRVYYTDAFRKDNEVYEGFMAMCVLFMTVQLMHYKYLEADITRDFYDIESIRYVYESYGVPYFSSIPLEYHKKIIKNINRLISYKGSTRVFFDLFDLFDYGHMDVFEYYLLKTRKFKDGVPVTILDRDGNEDIRAMYDIKFGKVKLYNDPALELSNVANHMEYEAMTLLDPYWVSDEELISKLYEEEDFNYLETKYIGIQTLFDMMQIMYESAYFFKMIFDNRIALKKASIFYNQLGKSINIFEMCVYVAALVCKKYGYEGNISSEYPFVARIFGYNFKADLTTVLNDIAKNQYLKKDTELNKLILNINPNSIASINSSFASIQNLRNHFTRKKHEARTKEEYFAYRNLEQTLLISNIVEEVYKKKDKTLAASFADLIADMNPDLYLRLNSKFVDVEDEIDNILILLKKTFPVLKYIEWADGIDISSLIEHLFKLLSFFKSAKAELTGYNIVYLISDRGANMFKLMSEISHIEFNGTMPDDYFKHLTDILEIGYEFKRMRDRLIALTDKGKYHDLKLYYKINEEIKKIDDLLILLYTFYKENFEYLNVTDVVHNIIIKDIYKSFIAFSDEANLIFEKIEYHTTIHKIESKIDYFQAMIETVYEKIGPIKDFLIYKDAIEKVSQKFFTIDCNRNPSALELVDFIDKVLNTTIVDEKIKKMLFVYRQSFFRYNLFSNLELAAQIGLYYAEKLITEKEITLMDYMILVQNKDKIEDYLLYDEKFTLVYQKIEFNFTQLLVRSDFKEFIAQIEKISSIHSPIIDELLLSYKDGICKIIEKFYRVDGDKDVVIRFDEVLDYYNKIILESDFKELIDKLLQPKYLIHISSICKLIDSIIEKRHTIIEDESKWLVIDSMISISIFEIIVDVLESKDNLNLLSLEVFTDITEMKLNSNFNKFTSKIGKETLIISDKNIDAVLDLNMKIEKIVEKIYNLGYQYDDKSLILPKDEVLQMVRNVILESKINMFIAKVVDEKLNIYKPDLLKLLDNILGKQSILTELNMKLTDLISDVDFKAVIKDILDHKDDLQLLSEEKFIEITETKISTEFDKLKASIESLRLEYLKAYSSSFDRLNTKVDKIIENIFNFGSYYGINSIELKDELIQLIRNVTFESKFNLLIGKLINQDFIIHQPDIMKLVDETLFFTDITIEDITNQIADLIYGVEFREVIRDILENKDNLKLLSIEKFTELTEMNINSDFNELTDEINITRLNYLKSHSSAFKKFIDKVDSMIETIFGLGSIKDVSAIIWRDELIQLIRDIIFESKFKLLIADIVDEKIIIETNDKLNLNVDTIYIDLKTFEDISSILVDAIQNVNHFTIINDILKQKDSLKLIYEERIAEVTEQFVSSDFDKLTDELVKEYLNSILNTKLNLDANIDFENLKIYNVGSYDNNGSLVLAKEDFVRILRDIIFKSKFNLLIADIVEERLILNQDSIMNLDTNAFLEEYAYINEFPVPCMDMIQKCYFQNSFYDILLRGDNLELIYSTDVKNYTEEFIFEKAQAIVNDFRDQVILSQISNTIPMSYLNLHHYKFVRISENVIDNIDEDRTVLGMMNYELISSINNLIPLKTHIQKLFAEADLQSSMTEVNTNALMENEIIVKTLEVLYDFPPFVKPFESFINKIITTNKVNDSLEFKHLLLSVISIITQENKLINDIMSFNDKVILLSEVTE